jgi:diguanylate cyclase (GGDEF)-like protein
MRLKFRTKLTIFIGAILVAIQLVNSVSVYTSSRKIAIEQGRKQVGFAGNILNRQIDDLTAQLADGARAVTLDYSFREAIALGDTPTQRSVILNLEDRINADRVILISLEDDVIFDTGRREFQESRFPFPAMLLEAEEEGRSVAIATLDDTLYRLVIVPVLAPEPIAWIAIGLEINDALAQRLRLRAPIPLDVSFAFRSENKWRLAATSLGRAERVLLDGALERVAEATSPEFEDLADTAYIVFAAPVKSGDEYADVALLLQYSVQEAISRTYPLLISMSALLFGGLGLALLGGLMLARGVSRPLGELVNVAERIGEGDYDNQIDLKGNDEFSALSATFNDMMLSIREREEQISHQARYDSLTGLLNRREFVRNLVERLEGSPSETCAVIVIGVVRLAETNSTLGYEAGDSMILEISRRLSVAIGKDDILGRLGGDTFGMLVDGASRAEMEKITARLEGQFEEPIPILDFELAVDLRFGISFHDVDENGEQLIHQAEVAEFKARDGGRHWYIFDPENDVVDPEQLLLIGEMRSALLENQFELFYQPKIDLLTETIIAVEALIRWPHPERGMVPPDRFIPLAEQTGDVRMLTQWVIKRALRDGAALCQRGWDIQVAVNLSALDLSNRNLPTQIANELSIANLPSNLLVLEITENSLMAEPSVAKSLMKTLNDTGVSLSIDDYGTGYSSLAYLKDLPIAEIKIDQTFVRELATNSGDELIVSSTVDLGHNLGLKVTAEGIEDEVAFQRLQKMGCDVGQGYFIARPMPIEDLEKFLKAANKVRQYASG